MNLHEQAEIIRLLDSAATRIEGLRTGQTAGTTAATVALSLLDVLAAMRIFVEATEVPPPGQEEPS